MPLYNNILTSKKNEPVSSSTGDFGSNQGNKSSSSASMKFLQDHLQSKKRSQLPNTIGNNTKVQKTNKSNENIIISESCLHRQSENDWNPEDEYDPMVPNSYEILQLAYIKEKEQKLLQLKTQQSSTPMTGKKTIPNLLEVLDKFDDEDDDNFSSDINNKKNSSRGTAIAPPLALGSDNVNLIEGAQVNRVSDKKEDSSSKQDGSYSVAAKIMLKMGYKVGQGLGKDEQGMSRPIEVERSGINTCRIVTSNDNKQNQTKSQASSSKSANKSDEQSNIKELLKDSTRILLLQNMVGPGEADDELELETMEECKKYGDVVKCLIYEIPNKKVPDEQAVRIFVEFRQVESAIKAVSDLDGRYFGGRVVKASFYNLERFNKRELGPEMSKR